MAERYWITVSPNHRCNRAAEYDPDDRGKLERHQLRCKWYLSYGHCRLTRPVGKREAKQMRRWDAEDATEART